MKMDVRKACFSAAISLTTSFSGGLVWSESMEEAALVDGITSLIFSSERASKELFRLCGIYCSGGLAGGEALDSFTTSLQGLSGDTLAIDQSVIDEILDDARKLERLSGRPPGFPALTENEVAVINADDPEESFQVLNNFISRRDIYRDLLARWTEKRGDAQKIYDEASVMYIRAIEIDKRLGEVFARAGSEFLYGVWQFDRLRFDLNVPLLSALSERQEAARALLKSYNDGVLEMRLNIERTQNLVDATRLLEWFNAFEHKKGSSTESRQTEEDFLRTPLTADHLKGAQVSSEILLNLQTESEAEKFFSNALPEMSLGNRQVIQEATRLWTEAGRRDAEAARARKIATIVKSGLSLIQSGVALYSSPPSFDQAWWFSESWRWSIDPNGMPTIELQRGGGEGNPPSGLR